MHPKYLSIFFTQVRTQMAREAFVAKEAKYQTGLKKSQEVDYTNVLQSIQNTASNRQGLLRGSWARRLSRISNNTDASDEANGKNKRNNATTTLWEVT